jgi:MFS family permease
MLGLSLAIVSNAFSAERQEQALGIWAGVSAVALAVGPLVGGLLLELDWRLIFWINLPISALGVAIILFAPRESRDEEAGRRVDLPGLAMLTFGLGALVLGIVQSDVWGWGAAQTLALVGGGALLLAAFWVIEHRVSEPIVDFSLFRNGPYLGATAAAFALVGSYWSLMFFESQFLQTVLDHGPVAAGVLILPVTAPMVVVSPFSGRLIERFGARGLMTAGMLCGVIGLYVLTRADADSSYPDLLPGYALFGIALGLVYAPMSTAAMAAMPRAKAGIAAGVLAMNRVLAGALGLAVTGAVFQSVRSDHLLGGAGAERAFALALSDALWILVGLVGGGALLTWLLVRDPSGERPESAPEHRSRHRIFHL